MKVNLIKNIVGTTLLIMGISIANPLLNVNTEDREVYENLEASENVNKINFSIKPMSYYDLMPYMDNFRIERIRPWINSLDHSEFYIKPINSLTTKFYITNEEYSFIPNQSGLKLRKGANLFIFEDGLVSLGKRAVLYYQLRQTKNKDYTKNELFRTYLKLFFYKFSFEAGIDNVHWGPGEYGNLLSNNAKPYPMFKLQTEDPIRFLGKWDFSFVKGYLHEDRLDRDNPELMALRVVWKPFSWLEIGGTRLSLYGGTGRPTYKLIEYPKVLIGDEENVSFSKYDTEGYAGWDFTIYLNFVKKWLKSIETAKFYYQESGTDVKAFWQKEDKGEFYFPFGIRFLGTAYVTGLFFSTKKSIYRLEFQSVSDIFYRHHFYNVENLTYKGMSLGNPYGRNILHFYFKHRYYFDDTFSMEYRLGFLQQPAYKLSLYPLRMKRYYASLLLSKKVKEFIFESYFRYDKTKNYDINPLPTKFDIVPEDKNFYILGLSLSYRL